MIRKTYSCLDFVNNNRLEGARARALEAALFELFAAEARGRTPPPEALLRLHAELSRCYRKPLLTRGRAGYALTWGSESALSEIVRAAVDLLTSDDVSRLRVCAADDCDWLFLDRSKNGSRRWCDMKVCGNRAKAKRFYARWS